MPSGTPSATASPSEPNTSSRCSREQPAEVGREQRARCRLGATLGRLSLRSALRTLLRCRATKPARDLREAAAVELDLRVERDHRRRVDAAFEAAQRRRVERGAHQQHRVVARKEGAVVLEHAQADSARPWRRSSRRRSRRPCRRRSRRRRARGRARRRLRSAARRPPSAPASRRRAAGTRATGRAAACGAAAEQGRTSCAMPSACARDSQHRERIGVVEAERHRGLQAARREPGIELVRGPGCLRASAARARSCRCTRDRRRSRRWPAPVRGCRCCRAPGGARPRRPAPAASGVTISPRMYDSVKRFEPTLTGSAPSARGAAMQTSSPMQDMCHAAPDCESPRIAHHRRDSGRRTTHRPSMCRNGPAHRRAACRVSVRHRSGQTAKADCALPALRCASMRQ